MTPIHKTISGFTLPEVLLTTAIIAIVSAFSLVSLSDTKKHQEVEGAMREVASAIREAQSYALNGKNISNVPSARPCLFRVRANGNPDAWSFQVEQMDVGHAQCPGGGSDADDEWSSIAHKTQNGVTVDASVLRMAVSAKAVRFAVPRGEPIANGIELSDDDAIDFTLSKGGVTAHVCVYALGRVEEKGVGAGGC